MNIDNVMAAPLIEPEGDFSVCVDGSKPCAAASEWSRSNCWQDYRSINSAVVKQGT